MKLVTMLAEVDGEKCFNLDMYNTRLLAVARYARFSNTSTPMVCHVGKIEIYECILSNFVTKKMIKKILYTIKRITFI